jgi:hypothetical protein
MKIRNLYPLSILLIFMQFFTQLGFAQNGPMLVKDINVGSIGSNPNTFATLGNKAFFIADDANVNSRKVYQSDGTNTGTVPISGYSGAVLDYALTAWNGQVYFVTSVNNALSTFNSILLYRTNGTTTALVDTLITGNPQVVQYSAVVTVINNQLYYSLSKIFFRGSDVSLFAHNGQRNGSKIITTTASTSGSTGGSFSTTTSKVFYGTNTFYLFSESSSSSPFLTKEVKVVRNTTPTSTPKVLNTSTFSTLTGQTTGNPVIPLETIGDFFYCFNQDTLFRFDSVGVKTTVKTGVGTSITGFIQKANNALYFINSANQVWKTDGTNGGTTLLNFNFDTPNENIINLFGNSNAAYIITLANGISRTYYITPQGRLSRVNFDQNVTYSDPFSLNGKQYIIASSLTNTTANCPENYLIRYEQTEAQSQFFELKRGLNLCETTYETPSSIGITDNDVAFYPMNTVSLGRELYKLDLKSTATSFCASKSTLPWEYWIANVKLGTINNTSDKFKDYNTAGYSDYTNLTTTLNKGQSYPLSISPGLSWIGNVPNAYARAWIDFNNNNTFESNELVLEKTNANPLTANVLVPTNAVAGAVRMRVALKYGAYPTACETFEKGEVEDYTINITEGSSVCDNDVTAPVFTSCPQSQIKGYAAGSITFSWSPSSVVFTDNCGVVSGSYRSKSGTLITNFATITQIQYNLPANTALPFIDSVFYTIADARGNSAVCSFELKITNDLPDLTLANLTIPTPSVQQGQILNWKVDIKNIGTAAVTGNFTIKAYISTDNVLSANDIQNGVIPTGNYAAGLTQAQVSGASTIPATLAAGNYYLILKVDGDNQITEKNEDNNVIISTSVITVTTPVNNSCRFQDSLQLVSLYNATNGANWRTKWNLNTPINTWLGVTLNADGCVQSIVMYDNLLVGTLPNLNIPNLTSLIISSTQLSGNIPNFNLPKLEKLDLSINKLSGQIPNFNLPLLKELGLSTNLLTGTIPSFNLPNLTSLALNNNLLTGTIPNFNLPNLQQLYLYNNQLSGAIPNFSMSNLSEIDIATNRLSGTLPNFNLPKLIFLNLRSNQLTGSIPSWNFPLLSVLSLKYNALSGCIPLSLKNLCGRNIDISNNPSLATQDFAAFCANNTGACQTNLPDLTLANLTLPTPSVQQGQDLFFNVDIKNSGTAIASGEVNVQTYVSTDNILSANDIPLGGIIVLDVAAGTTRQQVGGVLTPTNGISVGQYYLILKVDGNERLTESNENNNLISIPFSITTPQTSGDYCVSKGTSPWQEWISGVQFANINNTSQKEGYGNFTNLTATLVQGTLYPITITRGFSWPTDPTNATQKGIIWIDFNQNKTFEVSEIVSTFTRNVNTQSIYVPVGAKLGTTRMRVSFKTIGEPTPCETFDKGEVEDYTVNIQGGNDPCATDVTPPVIANCPKSETRTILTGECVTLLWAPPTATDNCSTPTLSFRSKASNTLRPESSPTQAIFNTCTSDSMFYTATDARGNKSVCAFAVTLINGCAPRYATSRGTTTINLNTTGTCAPYKWEVLADFYPCGRPCQYQGWGRTSVTPNLTVTRVSSLCAQINLDSACFPIGKTTLIYAGGNGQLDTLVVDVKTQTTGGTDIALSMTSTPSVYRQYSTNNFKITAQNIGNQAVTNAKIEFKFPAKTVTGGAVVPSVGTWQEWCVGGVQCFTWTIPSLAANASATLNVPLFIQDATGNIVATTKLLTSTPVDGNAANNSASVTLTPTAPAPAIQSLSRPKPTQYLPIIVQSIAPNPTEGDVVIEVESLKEQVVQFEFSNTMGQVIRTEKRPLEKGTNQVKFDVYAFPDGVYLIQTDVNRGRVSPSKFVKF